MEGEDSISSNTDDLGEPDVKAILLGDSAVGKSKLVERFLDDEFNPRRVSFLIRTPKVYAHLLQPNNCHTSSPRTLLQYIART
jgi:GTPase SAR1 family protein